MIFEARLRILNLRREIVANWRSILVLALFLAIIATFARTFIGDSPSPYGACYATSGRAVPCKALHH
jgi:hypothetical protein